MAVNDPSEIKEKDVAGYPGWKKLQMGTSRRYISPGGVEISARRFMELSSKYKNSFIPESDILPSIGRKPFISDVSSTKSPKNQHSHGPDLTDPGLSDQSLSELNLPEPKSHTTKPRPGVATAKELADGVYITLSIVSSIVALLTKTPDLQMQDMEAKNIAIPAGNLIEPTDLNKRFGRMIAESGDWQLLGYAIWLYISRVTDVVKEKQRAAVKSTGATQPTTQTNVPADRGAANGNGYVGQGALLPYSNQGTRRFA